MKRITISITLILLFHLNTFSQFLFGLDKLIDAVKPQPVVDKVAAAQQKKILAQTIATVTKLKEVVNKTKEVKNVVGTTAATMKDFRNLFQMVHNDIESLTVFEKEELNSLKEIFSFQDALSGRGYTSLFQLTDWYVSETSKFRDKNGNINATTAILNATDPETALRKYQDLNNFKLYVHQQQFLVNDAMILHHIRWARHYDRAARLRLMLLNAIIYSKSVEGLIKDGKSILKTNNNNKTNNPEKNITAESPTVKDDLYNEPLKNIKEKFTRMSQEGVQQLSTSIGEYMAKADYHRNKAYELFSKQFRTYLREAEYTMQVQAYIYYSRLVHSNKIRDNQASVYPQHNKNWTR